MQLVVCIIAPAGQASLWLNIRLNLATVLGHVALSLFLCKHPTSWKTVCRCSHSHSTHLPANNACSSKGNSFGPNTSPICEVAVTVSTCECSAIEQHAVNTAQAFNLGDAGGALR